MVVALTSATRQGWRVLLIGGRSGLGKSTLAAQVAARRGACCLQTDDLRMALQSATTPNTHPALHYFVDAPGQARPDIWHHSPEELCQGLISVAGVVSRSLAVVISHHLVRAGPLVVEGDAILPVLATSAEFATAVIGGALRAIFLIESDDGAPNGTALADSAAPGESEQSTILAMHRRYGCWLRSEAQRLGLAVLPAPPYVTLLERTESLLT